MGGTHQRPGRARIRPFHRAVRPLLVSAALACGAAGPPGAASCTGCHAPGQGVGVLQGRPAADIVTQMEAFRSGARPATLMNRIVRGFSPEEVQALATWFAAP